jgi:phosphoenolpyruvate carboxylase
MPLFLCKYGRQRIIAGYQRKSRCKRKKEELIDFLENFNVRTVLTAHPTQFYPGSVLGIINDLTEAIRENNLLNIKELGAIRKNAFYKKTKSLIHLMKQLV